LQCSPSFFESPRYDCVIVKTQDQPFFACLVYLFRCSISETVLSLMLIHPYDVAISHCRRHDIQTSATYPNRRECSIRPKRTAIEATFF
ncbi:hypothetical protein DFJ58DRAFT_669890, partial [Suillus subalutaceus]|uniref:uncharacterized protein n=1 Tax=Suillus subalutaceus TaxID=48586 RepID=UPI001B87180A